MVGQSLILAIMLAGGNLPPPTVDLSSIDRSIKKEPVYQMPAQQYCLLVFGPKAETRVWLAVDGNTLYIDRNGNGDLTEPGERINKRYSSFQAGRITEKDGRTTHTDLYIRGYANGRYRIYLRGSRNGRQYVGDRIREKPQFSVSPSTAPIIHFDGPMALKQFSTDVTIPRNEKVSVRSRSLRVMFGTPGLGKGTFVAVHCQCRRAYGPLHVHLSFPAKEANKRLTQKMVLQTLN